MNRIQFVVLLSTVCLCGCGGDSKLGSVDGTVTLDGQPVSEAMISFSPTKGGSPSNGRTDTGGKYSLKYTRSLDGAEIGEHAVRITTYQAANPDAEPPIPAVPEKIPAKYNSATEVKVEVKSGSNTHDFPLKTDGPVVQPAPDRPDC